MKAEELVPAPNRKCPFRLSHQKSVPPTGGCYVLSSQCETILYVGLTANLFRRFEEHWDNSQKRSLTPGGRAVWFHWLETRAWESVERGWMNLHAAREGGLPVLNKIFSPTSV